MSADAQSWSSRSADKSGLDPEQLLQELGWPGQSAAGERAAAAPSAGAATRYCSFCWCALPAGASECEDCGRSLQEMEQVRVDRAESDKAWIPPRQVGTSRRRPRGRTVPRPASQAWPSPAAVETSRRLLLAGGALAFLAGVAVTGFWLALAITPKTSRIKPAPAHPAVPKPQPAVAAAAIGSSAAPVRVTWRNPYPEIRVELLNRAGKPVASSSGPLETPLKKGQYGLRLVDKQGRWRSPVQPVSATSGTWTVTPPASLVADYYLWLGKRMHVEGEGLKAERAWRKAIQASANCSEARLELAALLAVRFKYTEAKSLVAQVLAQSPSDERAQRLQETLAKLDRR